MMEALRVLFPRYYFAEYFAKDIRPDGRRFDEFQPLQLTVNSLSSVRNSCLVKLGQSSVICTIRAETGKPHFETPTLGSLTINVEFPAIASSKFRSVAYNRHGQLTAIQLTDIVTKSKCFDLGQLMIAAGQSCWHLTCDFVCLNYDGSLIDAFLIAFVKTVLAMELPRMEYAPERNGLVAVEALETHDGFFRLRLQTIPFAVTFAQFKSTIVTEPNDEEEDLCDGKLLIVANLRDPRERFLIENNFGDVSDAHTCSPPIDLLNTCFDLIGKRAEFLRANFEFE